MIQLAKKVNKSTFESIITPVSDMDRVLALTSRIKLRMVDLFNTYPPPRFPGMTWCPTWKALPTHRVTRVNRMKLPYGRVRGLKSSFTSLPYEISSLNFLVHSRGEQWSMGALWPSYIRYPLDPLNKMISGWSLDEYERFTGPLLPFPYFF